MKKDAGKTKGQLEKEAASLRKQLAVLRRNITERKGTEEALLLRAQVLGNMSEGVSFSDEHGVIRYTNPAEDAMFGYKQGELIGKHVTVLNAYSPEENARIVGAVIEQLRTSGAWQGEFWNRKKDGATFYTAAYISALEILGRKHWICVQTDITEHKQAEEVLRESQDRLGLAIRATNLGPWDWDLRTNAVVFSPEWKRQIGYEEHEIQSRYEEWESRLHPEDRERVLDALRAYLDARQPEYAVEFRLRHKDGSYRWIYTRGIALRDANDKPSRMLGCHMDVTERKQAVEGLQKSEAMLKQAEAVAHLGSWEWDGVQGILTWSEETYRIFEINPAEFGASYEAFLDVIHSEDRELVDRAYTESVKHRTPYDVVHRLLMRDGRIKFVHERCKTFYDAQGTALRSIGTVQDITEHKRAEEALRESEGRYKALVENAPVCIHELDRQGRFLSMNQAGLKMMRVEDEALIHGLAYPDVAAPEDRERIRGLLARAYAGEDSEFEFSAITDRGSRNFASCFIPLKDADRSVIKLMGITQDITERKRADATLRESEEQFRALYDDNPSMYFTVDADGTVLSVNRFGTEQLGYRPDELIGHSVLAVFHEEDRQKAAEYLRAAFQAPAQVHQWELRKVRKDGRVLWVREDVRIIQDSGGKPLALVVCEDITAAKQAEEALRESQKQYQELMATIDGIVWEADARTFQFSFISQQAERLLGYPLECWLTEPNFWKEHIHPDDRSWAVGFCVSAVQEKRDHDFEYRMLAADGRILWLRDIVNVVVEDGQATKLRGVMVDVTERKRADAALHESGERFRALYDDNPSMYFTVDADGTVLSVNRFGTEQLGYRPDELIRHSVLAVFHEEDRQKAAEYLRAAFQAPAQVHQWELRKVRKDGRVLWVREDVRIIQDSGGKPLALVVCEDITERKGAEQALTVKTGQLQAITDAITTFLENEDWREASARILRAALHQTQSQYGFIGVLAEGPVLRILAHEGMAWDPNINRTFYESAVRQYQEKGFLEFADFDNLFGRVITGRQTVVSNEPGSDPRSGGLPLGHPPLRHFLGVPILRGPEVVGMIGVADRPGGYEQVEQDTLAILTHAASVLYDSYRRRQRETDLQDQLRQSQKLEAIGRLAGGIAHDFNNLLTAIMGSGEIMLAQLSDADALRLHLDEIKTAVHRGSSLTHQLLAFSRQQVLQPTVLELSALVTEMAKMLHRLIGEDIELLLVSGTEQVCVKTDRGQLEQVVLNLALNARDAMSGGGRLTIETRGVSLEAPHCPPTLSAGRYARLLVRDTGCGMDETTRAHIFEPFFTTKALGKGTGLGLATVHGIVKQSGGTVTVESAPGLGTTFTVYLPAVTEAPHLEAPGGSLAVSQRGAETVLLVEDDDLVRGPIAKALSLAGYAVLVATGPAEALRMAGERGVLIHLLVTDVVMPRMNGWDLAQRVMVLHPRIKVLYMSGYPDDILGRAGSVDPPLAFLPKPFTLDDLARKVRDVLDGAHYTHGV